jgi:GxxExxY protein
MLEYEHLTERIIGCAYKVYNKMGFGFLESVYEKCMIIELEKAGLRVESQKPILVYYEGKEVSEFFADLFVEDTIIIELKSLRNLATAHEVQLVNYLVATNTEIGLLVNFSENRVEVKRKKRSLAKDVGLT